MSPELAGPMTPVYAGRGEDALPLDLAAGGERSPPAARLSSTRLNGDDERPRPQFSRRSPAPARVVGQRRGGRPRPRPQSSRSPAERTLRALPPPPRQRPVVLLHQLPVLGRHVVRAREEQPRALVALDLAAERVLELLEPVDDLRLEALDGGEVLEVGAVQLAQAADRLVERRDVDALRGERAADLLGLGLPLLDLTAELADVVGAELDGAAEIGRASW